MKTSGSQAISQKLQMLRRGTRLSVKDVADQLGVAESTYRDWEYGRAIKGEPYVKLAEVFGVSLSELLLPSVTNEKAFVLARIKEIEDALKSIKLSV